jgi:hypothetical protein
MTGDREQWKIIELEHWGMRMTASVTVNVQCGEGIHVNR